MKQIHSQEVIEKLRLLPHPEGGYYKELYRSHEEIDAVHLPTRYGGNRSFYTSIYFLLTKDDISKFHKIQSDEIWHFYMGDPLELYVINREGKLTIQKLGLDLNNDEKPQIMIKKDCWFAAKISGEDYTLVGCSVSPGFDFNDFMLAKREKLVDEYPHLRTIIEEFT